MDVIKKLIQIVEGKMLQHIVSDDVLKRPIGIRKRGKHIASLDIEALSSQVADRDGVIVDAGGVRVY